MADDWITRAKRGSSFSGSDVVDTTPVAPVSPDPVAVEPSAPAVPPYVPQETKAGGAEALAGLKQYAAENGYYIDTGTSGDAPRFYKIIDGGTDEFGETVGPKRVEVNPASDPFALGLLQQFHSYTTSAAGGGAASGSGGSGSGAAAKYVDPILAYLNSGEVKLEEARSDEVSRQMKDALTRLNALYDMEDSDQSYAMNATQANLAQEKAWRSGAADWESPGARTYVPSRPQREIEQALQQQLALSAPDTIMPDYGMAGTLGIQGRQGYDDQNFDFNQWYAKGTITADELPRYADGTYTNNPFLNMQMPTLPWSGSSVQTGNSAVPGMYNSNQFLPASQQAFGGQEWDALALTTMLKNIKEGNAGAPIGWTGSNLAAWSGQDLPPSMQAELAQWIRNNGQNADLTYMLGTRPGDRGSAYTTVPLTPQEQQAYDLNNLNAYNQMVNTGLNLQKYIDSVNSAQGAGGGGGGGSIRMSGSSGGYTPVQYGGSYGAAQEGDPDLQEKLALEYAKLKLQEEIQRGELDEAKLNGVVDRAYKDALTGNIANTYDLQLKQFAEDQLNNSFQRDMTERQFQEQLRRAQIEEQQRAQELGIKRGAAIAELGANPGDAVQRQFFINQGTQPVGQSQDAFTGQSTGNKTYDQIAQENAPLYWQNNNRQTLQTMWGGGPIHDPMFVVGDKRNGKPHGTEEVVINWTGAPLDVVSNKEAVKAGLVPAARKRGR